MLYNKIKLLCDEKRISIPELSEKIGLSKTGLYKSIANKTMKVDTLEKIAETLGVSIYEFFEFDINSSTQKNIDARRDDLQTQLETIELLEKELNAIERDLSYIEKTVKSQDSIIKIKNLLLNQQKNVIALFERIIFTEKHWDKENPT